MLFEQYLTHKSQNIQKCAWVEGLHNWCHLTSSYGKVDGARPGLELKNLSGRAHTVEALYILRARRLWIRKAWLHWIKAMVLLDRRNWTAESVSPHGTYTHQ